MWLRQGDSQTQLSGRVIWIIGRRDSGKTTLIDGLQKSAIPNLIACDDFLRCRTGITGKDDNAYNRMIGLGFALAYQGYDVLMPCGARYRKLRDRIRSEIPSSIFVYIEKRGRPCADYEEPGPDENVIRIAGETSPAEGVEICLKTLWPELAGSMTSSIAS